MSQAEQTDTYWEVNATGEPVPPLSELKTKAKERAGNYGADDVTPEGDGEAWANIRLGHSVLCQYFRYCDEYRFWQITWDPEVPNDEEGRNPSWRAQACFEPDVVDLFPAE